MSDCATTCSALNTGNVEPLLHEIRHALRELLESGVGRIIDLRALPLAPGEEDRLDAELGAGEVQITLNALGESDIRETRISGVWRVVHYNTEGEIIGKFIEIARVPELIAAQIEDMQSSLLALDQQLGETSQA